MKLHELQMIVNDLNATNSITDKRNKLSKHKNNEELTKLLGIIYSPYKRFHLSVKTYALKAPHIDAAEVSTDLFSLLSELSTGNYKGDRGVAMVKAFIENQPEHEMLILMALDKNLKIRMNAGSINRAIPNTIEEFSVALGLPYDDKTKRELTKGTWLASRKLDGCRVVTIIDENGEINFYSRAGNEFTTLSVLKQELKKANIPNNTVIEGEVCILDKNGDEDFKATVSEIKKKDHTIFNPVYKVFDILSFDHFLAKECEDKLSDRLKFADEAEFFTFTPSISILEQLPFTHKDMTKVEELKKESLEKGWEGLMFRKDTGYKGKRSSDILKYKQFQDAEYQVVSRTLGKMQVVVGGKTVDEEVMSNVTILHKGNPVDVGSGFSLNERRLFRDNPNLIVGQLITVQYFEETYDKEGKLSLRFPTFKMLHGETREL